MLEFATDDEFIEWWTAHNIGRPAHDLTVRDIQLHIPEGVFSPDPDYTYSPFNILDNVPDLAGKDILDIGTGSGLFAVYAARQGAKSVTGVDSYSDIVEAARQNVLANDVADRVTVRESDLFENVNGTFDCILANLPVSDKSWPHIAEALDGIHGQLLSDYPDYLKDGGRLYLSYASFGQPSNIEMIAEHLKRPYVKQTTRKFGVDWILYIFS